MTTASRVPRGRRGTTATVVALIGVLSAAFGATQAIWATVHHRPWLISATAMPRYLHRLRWQDSVVLVVAIVAIVLGALLILGALLPPRRRLVELTGTDDAAPIGVTRRSIRRSLAAAAQDVDGVGSARLTLTRRRVKVRASTTLRHTDGLDERVVAKVESRLAALATRTPRSVHVTLAERDD